MYFLHIDVRKWIQMWFSALYICRFLSVNHYSVFSDINVSRTFPPLSTLSYTDCWLNKFLSSLVHSVLLTNFTHSRGWTEAQSRKKKIILTLTNCNTSSSFGIIVSSKRFSLNENTRKAAMRIFNEAKQQNPEKTTSIPVLDECDNLRIGLSQNALPINLHQSVSWSIHKHTYKEGLKQKRIIGATY